MGYETREFCVLAVDDDRGIREFLDVMLTEENCRVFTAPDGAEAVKILEEERVDLLIADYMMPGMNGLELVRWCERRFPHVATVIITGHDPQTLTAEGTGCGELRVLRKPFSTEQLLALVEELREAVPTS
jgi:DNA-binding response OmpR family regulator